MTTGVSLPANATAATFDTAGKADNQSLPPAATGPGGWDISWNNLGPALANIPGLGLTAPRFLISLTLASTSGALVVNSWRSVWQNATSTAPVVARSSTGIYTITVPQVVSSEWDSSQSPPVLNNYAISFIGGTVSWNSVPSVGSAAMVPCVTFNNNIITVTTLNTSASPTDFASNIVFVQAF